MKKRSIFYAILAASLYAINIPLSKIFLNYVEPTMMAAFLYLGAGIGLFLYRLLKKIKGKDNKKDSLTRKELPYTIAMVILDIIAPILLMLGISICTSANVSLLNNFEIVSTSLIALFIFKETISKKLWVAICLVTIASIFLSFEGVGSLSFNYGSLFVLSACLCWGFENNCTRMLSNKSSIEIVTIKGLFSGLGSLIIALFISESIPNFKWILCVLVLGFISYGLSINFYIKAQKNLGAAKTSAYYSIAPFLGVAFSLIILGERPNLLFFIALIIIIISTYFMIKDSIELQHTHEHEHIHTHEHQHGSLIHSHEHSHKHTHLHVHVDGKEEHEHVSIHDLNDHCHIHVTSE